MMMAKERMSLKVVQSGQSREKVGPTTTFSQEQTHVYSNVNNTLRVPIDRESKFLLVVHIMSWSDCETI